MPSPKTPKSVTKKAQARKYQKNVGTPMSLAMLLNSAAPASIRKAMASILASPKPRKTPTKTKGVVRRSIAKSVRRQLF